MTQTLSQPQTLSVEYQELMARADEVEAAFPGQPADNPAAPCALATVAAAAAQLALSADNMRLYLGVGERERRRLADSLRNAAKAYEEVDESAEEAINDGTSISAAAPGVADEGPDPLTLSDTKKVGGSSIEATPYYPVRQAAEEIAELDQGVSFDLFAQAWTDHQRALLEARYRFRPFVDWYGDATYAVEDNFDSHRSWLDQMAALSGAMVSQAQGVVSTHRWAVTEHPTVAQLKELDDAWVYFQSHLPAQHWKGSVKPALEEEYARLQKKSEEVLAEYERRAALPLAPINPPKPPAAYYIAPPPEPGSYETDPDTPYGELPYGDEYLTTPTGMPSAPFAGTPAMPTDPTGAGVWRGAPAPPKTPGLKPAGLGGGGAGVPSMPLQPAVDAEAPSRPAGAAAGSAGPGRGMPGRSDALGGGMGAAPMGAPGPQGQQNGKGKRAQQDQESLYTERRPWTEGVIGRRRREVVEDKDPR
ncbi:secretion protein EspB [Mycobacterium sp. SMC-2]|uniref:PPE domain-containing protein n=1 Tax=Mycobacterium sp. SMC-2 TaxID=2857058 RepID=UPI0021B468DC|nr:secretion protein EspB [Mycobacterium sp. SMC-2]UXA07128.1 secretion protein EspB [Mycobacterium sp. SMC-2]